MKRALLLLWLLLVSGCAITAPTSGQPQTDVQATQIADLQATIQTMATLIAPARSATATPQVHTPTVTPTMPATPTVETHAEEETMQSWPTATRTPLTPPQAFTTPAGLRLVVHRVWWATQVADFSAKKGKRFLLLDVEVQNPTEATVEYAPALYLTAQSALGFVFRPIPLSGERFFVLGGLLPGGHLRGWVAFELYPDEGPFSLYLDDAVLANGHRPLYLGTVPGPTKGQ